MQQEHLCSSRHTLYWTHVPGCVRTSSRVQLARRPPPFASLQQDCMTQPAAHTQGLGVSPGCHSALLLLGPAPCCRQCRWQPGPGKRPTPPPPSLGCCSAPQVWCLQAAHHWNQRPDKDCSCIAKKIDNTTTRHNPCIQSAIPRSQVWVRLAPTSSSTHTAAAFAAGRQQHLHPPEWCIWLRPCR